jgi:hypothetical protein
VKAHRDAEAWIYVPKGLCDKVAGGRLLSADAEHGRKG